MIRILSFGDQHVKDHGVEESQCRNGGKTLCGLTLKGVNWFLRGNQAFDGKMNFHCSRCARKVNK